MIAGWTEDAIGEICDARYAAQDTTSLTSSFSLDRISLTFSSQSDSRLFSLQSVDRRCFDRLCCAGKKLHPSLRMLEQLP